MPVHHVPLDADIDTVVRRLQDDGHTVISLTHTDDDWTVVTRDDSEPKTTRQSYFPYGRIG